MVYYTRTIVEISSEICSVRAYTDRLSNRTHQDTLEHGMAVYIYRAKQVEVNMIILFILVSTLRIQSGIKDMRGRFYAKL